MKPLTIPSSLNSKYVDIKNKFSEEFKTAPEFFAKAPGRVNLIGEHIDYCGYSVLPIAIDQDIVIAAAKTKGKTIEISNTEAKYQGHSCSVNVSDFQINASDPKWFHYVLCGVKGVLEHLNVTESSGLALMVHGTIPKGAGLSSSSALVCAAAIATMHANDKQIDKHTLAEICQHCERFIGTEGGGMDQAISMLAELGKAKLIDFNPLHLTDVLLPESVRFLVTNCCVESNKAMTSHFNTRVAECRLAAQVLAASFGLEWQQIRTLKDLQTRLGADLTEMCNKVVKLHQEPYTKAEICECLDVSSEELDEISLNDKTKKVELFHLNQRATHVYKEAKRVNDFISLSRQICNSTDTDGLLNDLGQLMTDSHNSCSEMYDCSCQELDQLVKICREAGALGSRLTGAGWGGCAVSMIMKADLENFMGKVKDAYYDSSIELKAMVKDALFATRPADGANIYVFNNV